MENFEKKYLEAIDGISMLREVCCKGGYDKVVCFIDDFFPEIKRKYDIIESLVILLQTTPRVNEEDGSEHGVEYFRNVAKDFFENVNMSYRGWRPSENQMHQLRKMITALPDGEIHVVLKSLYDDLLKLIG